MAELEVRPVRTWRERRAFLRFPWLLYRDIPQWVPPIRYNQKELVGFASHPFYQQAQSQAYLAYRGKDLVGRILAIHNQAYLDRFPDQPVGFVGFFESVNDHEVASRLFDAAREWLRNRGLTVVQGPANPSHHYEWGLLVDAFDLPPTFMMTYNPAYYVPLWESYGFVKVQDLYTFVGHRDALATMGRKIFDVAQEATRRFRIVIRPLRAKHFRRDVETFLKIYNESNAGNWGHVPMSPAEVSKVSRGMRFLIVPELTRIAEIDGQPVGAVLGLLDYNPLVRRIDGRLFPFGFLTLLFRRRTIRRIRVVSTNVVPAYQRWGIGVVLTAHLVPPSLAWPVLEGEFSWVLESNELSVKTLIRGGMPREKTHRIYEIRD